VDAAKVVPGADGDAVLAEEEVVAGTAHRQPSPACLLRRETTQAVEHERRCAGIEVPALAGAGEERRGDDVRGRS